MMPRLLATFLAASFAAAGSLPVQADFDVPKKKIDCKKPENKNKAACKPKRGEASDDEIYHAAYWMAQSGDYAEALDVLRMAANADDPRILTAAGFATRKLGDVETALPLYHRALSLNPDYVLAREYLGEAHLSQGNLAAAEGELSEIARRCGTGCTAYVHLAAHVSAFKAGKS